MDDLLLTSNDSTQIQQMKRLLGDKYKMKDLGSVQRYLGVEFDRTTSDGLFLHLTNYTQDLINARINKFNMANCRQEFTPMPVGLVLHAETDTPAIDSTTYCRVVGKLIFLTHTRPDISHVVGIVSRLMQRPQKAHWDVVTHLLRYICTTPDFGILYSKSNEPAITSFTDADYLSCSSTCRSIGAYTSLSTCR